MLFYVIKIMFVVLLNVWALAKTTMKCCTVMVEMCSKELCLARKFRGDKIVMNRIVCAPFPLYHYVVDNCPFVLLLLL